MSIYSTEQAETLHTALYAKRCLGILFNYVKFTFTVQTVLAFSYYICKTEHSHDIRSLTFTHHVHAFRRVEVRERMSFCGLGHIHNTVRIPSEMISLFAAFATDDMMWTG